MSSTLILVGSPRGRVSTSSSLANYLKEVLVGHEMKASILWIIEHLVSHERTNVLLDSIERADNIVICAPLYDDCQPYNVTKTMELMSEQLDLQGKRFLTIINSGFPQPEQISYAAIPIYKFFASKTGMEWVGSLAIGGGEGLQGASGKTLLEAGGAAKNVISELTRIGDMLMTGSFYGDHEVLTFPKIFFNPTLGGITVWMNNRGWKAMAERNGEKVDAKPY